MDKGNDYPDKSDAEIWLALKAGDRQALKLLYDCYYADLFRYALKFSGSKLMAEDHIQKLFLKIWERREHLGDVTGVKTYLWTALRRSLITRLKEKDRLLISLNYSIQNAWPRMQFSPEDLIISEERRTQERKELKSALDQLSPRQREILYLKFYDGMSYQEIEEITSLSYQTIYNYVHESIKALKAILKIPKRNELASVEGV